MPRYMLDTDTCSYIMKRSNSGVLKRLSTLPVSDVCISVITKSELLFGVEVSPRRRQDEAALDAFLKYIEVLDFPDQASLHYARIRADLRRLGATSEDWSERPIHCGSRPQPGLDAGYQQHARVWAGLQVGDRKLDTLARQAYRDFGKTSGHAAKDNGSECSEPSSKSVV